MPAYRSRTTTHGRNMAGARGLWRATGMKNEDFGKPIIAVVNSFTQFVPGHVHLKDLGQLVAREIEKAGGVAKEFNTIAVDDGIAMGHDGMLYSLPSREIIAVIDRDGVELLGDAAGVLDLARDELAEVLEMDVARHELGERIDHRNDRLAEILVLHAGGAPEAAGARHVAAVGRGSGAVGGHDLSFLGSGKGVF